MCGRRILFEAAVNSEHELFWLIYSCLGILFIEVEIAFLIYLDAYFNGRIICWVFYSCFNAVF